MFPFLSMLCAASLQMTRKSISLYTAGNCAKQTQNTQSIICVMEVIRIKASRPSWRAWHSGSLHPLQKKRTSDRPLQQHRAWTDERQWIIHTVLCFMLILITGWLYVYCLYTQIKYEILESTNNLQDTPFDLPHGLVLSFLLWTILNKIGHLFLHLNRHVDSVRVKVEVESNGFQDKCSGFWGQVTFFLKAAFWRFSSSAIFFSLAACSWKDNGSWFHFSYYYSHVLA